MKRRLARWFFASAAALGLALCVTLAWLWVRSHRGPDYVVYTSPSQWYLGVTNGHGTVDVLYIAHWPQEPEFRRGRRDPHVYYGTRYSPRTLGFGRGISPSGGRFVNVPHWFLVTVAALATALFATAAWRRRGYAAGHCQRCGYDLRASGDRCPECGAAVKENSTTAPSRAV